MPHSLLLICRIYLLFTIASPLWALSVEDISKATASLDHARLLAADEEPGNWLSHGRTYQEQRYSLLDQINDKNVADLGLAWYFDVEGNRGLEASPIVIDGVMFSTGVWSVVYAHDALTGELLWQYDPKVPRHWGKMACCDVVNRGVAVWKGKVFSATLDGRLIALDARNGNKLWETMTLDHPLDPKYPYTITGAPRVIKGKVIIGNGGADFGVRGYLSAYDANSGEQLWRFYTVPGDPEKGFESEAIARAAKTWNGQWWEYGGGGTVWDSMVYDPELNLLYFGTGNGSPWNRDIRSPGGGDNLYISSIVAINPDNGKYVWHFQEVPQENFDYTATQHIIIADIELGGELKKVLLHAPKNGFFFVIDRLSGKLLSAEPYVEVNWASHYDLQTGRPVETPKASYQKNGASLIKPSSMGAHNWQPMAYNPDTGLVYIPAMESSFLYDAQDQDSYRHEPGHWNLGVKELQTPPGDQLFGKVLAKKISSGHLSAWDPVLQKERWRVQYQDPWNGGVLTTAGNLVFQGTFDGRFIAYRADTGEHLWKMPVQTSVMAPPVTFTVKGEQYITVLVGRGGAYGLGSGTEFVSIPKHSRILTFKLGGDINLPPIAIEDEYADPPPRLDVSAEVVMQGEKLFHTYCYGCHGFNVVSNKAVPDLRRLPRHFHDAFKNIVYDGDLSALGMVGFSDVLSEAEVEAIHAYIIERAHEDKAAREQSPWWLALKTKVYAFFADILIWLMSYY